MQLSLGLLLLILLVARCGGVDNSPGNPGTFDCNPTTTDASNFYNTVQTAGTGLIAVTTGGTTCLNCHGNTPGSGSVRARFRLNTINATDPNVQKQNLCVVYQWGQRSPDQEVLTHPQSTSHDGGQVTAAQISALVNWVQTYQLPSDQNPATY